MRKLILISAITILLFSCKTTPPVSRATAYKAMYTEKPLSILIMPPINKSVNVEAKEFFHSSLLVPLANAGFYVIPPFLSMEILKKESAYDAENFVNSSVTKFGEVFGADVALFTIIHKWEKSQIATQINIEIEYIFKSTKTGEILYSRRGEIIYDTSVNSGGGLASIALSAINTAATKNIKVARICNNYTFTDLPVGKYSPQNGLDGQLNSGPKKFKARLRSN